MRIKIIFSVLIFFVGNIYAGGAELNLIPRAKSLSLNGLYFAGNDGLNSILGNPAGLILVTNSFLDLSISDMIGQQKFEGDTKGLHKSFEEDHFAIGGGLAWSFYHDFVMGLSYQRALNYNVNWPFLALQKTDSSSSISAFDLYNRIKINAVSVSGAFRIHKLSFGVTASAYQVKHETAFPQENIEWYNHIGLPSYQFNYIEDGWTFGYGMGLLYEASTDLQIGLMTRSGYSADLSGTATTNMFAELDSAASKVDLSSRFEMPWVFGGGWFIVYMKT